MKIILTLIVGFISLFGETKSQGEIVFDKICANCHHNRITSYNVCYTKLLRVH